jgi:hypothetical protein
VVYSFLHTTKDLGDPGSSRGTLERVRVDLTQYTDWPHLVDLVWTGGGLGEDLTALHSLHHLSHRAHTF